MKSQPISILVADDNQSIRDSLAKLFGSAPETRLVGVASNGRQALEMALELKPVLVFMSTSMADMDGITLASRLQEKLPKVRVMAVSVHEDLQTLKQLEKREVCWFIRKNPTLERWFEGVLMVGTCAVTDLDRCPEACLSSGEESLRDILGDRVAHLEEFYFDALLQRKGKVDLSSWVERLHRTQPAEPESDKK